MCASYMPSVPNGRHKCSPGTDLNKLRRLDQYGVDHPEGVVDEARGDPREEEGDEGEVERELPARVAEQLAELSETKGSKT